MDEGGNNVVVSLDCSSTSANVDWSNHNVDGTDVETRLSDQEITDLGTSLVNRSFQQNWEFDITTACT